ncbi:hypothetical protein CEXT_615151 [Caerostris extrusa]|uniref:Uncharacterized protein n=1 Tax=Caerostris extrusa TaxID=172846 RepID=A0AAV4PRU4_CAEEX|nr:hypothetical protein CEXT_615151 [Caerostris extrusa]
MSYSLPNAASELRVPSGCECEIARFGGQHSFLLLSNSSFIFGKSDIFSRFISLHFLKNWPKKRAQVDSLHLVDSRRDGRVSSSLPNPLRAASPRDYTFRRAAFASPTKKEYHPLLLNISSELESPWLVRDYTCQWAAFVSPANSSFVFGKPELFSRFISLLYLPFSYDFLGSWQESRNNDEKIRPNIE